MKKRPYYQCLWGELAEEKNMVFMSGPRQAGKTTLALHLGESHGDSLYFNYDRMSDKAKLAKNSSFFEEIDRRHPGNPLVILDEIHKFTDWKNYLKSVYDEYAEWFHFLITGSGRLDLLTQQGDALSGRFLRFRLLPFTLGELFALSPRGDDFADLLDELPETNASSNEAMSALLRCSGFPEPFLKNNERSYRRWAQSYHRQIVRDDLRELTAIRNLSGVETLYALMPERVCNPFSVESLTHPLRVSHKTISAWLDVFERLFLIFKIRPYSRHVTRSLVKEPKYYFFDICLAPREGARLENLVAVELLRAVWSWTDFGLGAFDLHYLRTKDGVEVDFLVTRDQKPFFMVEVKSSDTQPSAGLIKMQNMLCIPAIQLVQKPGTRRIIKNNGFKIHIIHAADWLACLR